MREPPRLVHAAPGGEQVAVGQLDALGRAGRARGVDERQQVLGADRLPARIEVEPGRAPQLELVEGQHAGLAVDDDEGIERPLRQSERLRQPLLEGGLGHGHAGARVAQQVLHLLGRARRVDREGHGSEVDRRGIQ